MTEAHLPSQRGSFMKKFPQFKAWLLAHGSAIYEPTNNYELARFLTPEGIGIVYVNAAGAISSWMNGAAAAYQAFLSNTDWRGTKATKRKRADRDFLALVARDGSGCMYCDTLLTEETATIEHVCSTTHGGPNHLANKALACRGCNTKVGHLSVREKLEMAIKMRSAT